MKQKAAGESYWRVQVSAQSMEDFSNGWSLRRELPQAELSEAGGSSVQDAS